MPIFATYRSILNFTATSVLTLLLCVCMTGEVKAQHTDTAGGTPSLLTPGRPAGTYTLDGFDNVNLFNGNLNFSLPILTIKGRGSVSHTINLRIEQRWQVNRFSEEFGVYVPIAHWWTGIEPGYGPGTMEGRQLNESCGNSGFFAGLQMTRLYFTKPDGTEIEFRDQESRGEVKQGNCFPHGVYNGGFNRKRIFNAVDGSAATFISDTDIFDWAGTGEQYIFPTGNLMWADGTMYRIVQGVVVWMRDRNGNRLEFGGGAITDSLNRRVTITQYPQGGSRYDQIDYKGSNGAPRQIKIWYRPLEEVLREDFRVGTPPYTRTYAQLFPELPNNNSPTVHNPLRAASVELPDGRSYQFFYNLYGELARVVLPTGGTYEYDWIGYVTGPPDIVRRVSEKRVYPNGGQGSGFSLRTIFSDVQPGSGFFNSVFITEQRDSSNNLLAHSRHHFHGNALWESILWTPFQNKPFDDGREHETELFNTSGSSPTSLARELRRVWTATFWEPAPPSDTRLIEEITTLADTNQVSKQTFDYDQYNNPTELREYDFGASAPGSLIRRTQTDYVTVNNGVNYAADTNIHIRNLPLQQQVFDAGGTKRAETFYEYDYYNSDEFHAPLSDRPNISGHDGAFLAGYLTRGNVTRVSSALLDNNGGATGWINSHPQYDIAGNVIKVIDSTGNATLFDFRDNFGSPDDTAVQSSENPANNAPGELSGQVSYAFPFKITNALGHKAYTKYDYYLGRPALSEDANGVKSNIYHNDALDRPTRGRRAIGTSVASQTVFVYNDSGSPVNGYPARSIATISDKDVFGESNSGNGLKSVALYDGLGRTVRGATYEGSTWSITDTQFDALGRVSHVSNPYRAADPGSASAPSGLWTETVYDALGRVVDMETPDGAHVISQYTGTQVMVVDQAGQRRRSETDAVGRLIRVTEDPGNLNYETYYTYDALGNLRMVTQGSQVRTFAYDSLSRLISATNPESGTMTYAYDSNGNLTEKTDARGVRTTMTYDVINRVRSKAYSGTTPEGTAAANVTPPVNYFYDTYSGLPSGAPSFSGTPSKGRLVGVTYGPGSEGTYSKYDALGRVLTNHQRMGTSNYVTTYTYNRASAMTREDRGSPARRKNPMTYDTAGRLVAMTTAHWNGFGFVEHNLVNFISYTPFGAMQSETYGNGLIHTMAYNNRHQPTEIRLGRPDNLESVFRIGYIYGTANNVNSQDAEIALAQNNGNIARIKYSVSGTLQYTQTFQYDPLNRLGYAVEHNNGMHNDGARAWYQTFVYDRYGNRGINIANTSDNVDGANSALRLAEFSEANNRITRLGFVYDAAGNLIAEPGKSYTYDAENRIVTATVVGGGTSQYVYDGNGHRVKKIVGGVATRFEYGAGGELIAEWNDADAGRVVQKDYFYKGGELIATTKAGASGQYEYATADHLGSPRAWTDDSSNLVAGGRHDYAPFGEELGAGVGIRNASLGYGADSTRQKFTSKERDSETGLDYFGARYFASVQGRFTSPDPLEYWMIKVDKRDEFAANPQRWNKYVYVLNNPLRYVDPDGLAEIPQWSELDEVRRRDLAKRLGPDAEKIWNGWDNDQRQRVLNARAVLIEAGVWGNVTSITFGDLKKERNLFSANTASFTPNQKGWFLAITTDKDIGPTLQGNGWENRWNPNHPEAQTNWMQPGDGIVMHLAQLIPPDDKYSWIHWDTGGGRITSSEHFEEWRTGKGGASTDDVTRAIGKTKAGKYLMGISESMDKLLTQPKK